MKNKELHVTLICIRPYDIMMFDEKGCQMKKKIKFYCFLFSLTFFFILFPSCSKTKPNPNQKIEKELLVYCGVTMIQPMRKIADIVEKEHNCKITIIKGASSHLLKSIQVNKCGDIYFPGSESYIETAIKNDLIKRENIALLGYNKIAILVKKGNPLKIPSVLKTLADKKHRVVLGSPNSSSIGRETKKILEKRNLSKEIYQNVLFLTTDSEDLSQAIINDQADIVLNWQATGSWDNNKNFVTIIDIDEKWVSPQKMFAGILKYSKHPKTAKTLIEYASSEKGKAIFKEFGF